MNHETIHKECQKYTKNKIKKRQIFFGFVKYKYSSEKRILIVPNNQLFAEKASRKSTKIKVSHRYFCGFGDVFFGLLTLKEP